MSSSHKYSKVTPSQISPVPIVKKRMSNRGRKPAKSVIILSSPYKKDLENAQFKKSGKPKIAQKKNFKRKGKKNVTKNINERNITESESSDSNPAFYRNYTDSSEDIAMRNESAVPTDEDAECFFCNGKYSEDKRGEEWVKCLICEMWVHGDYGGYESGIYICDYRKN